jgi:pSer/pThr/pTyr-binding forkhead associated (FHA) protein
VATLRVYRGDQFVAPFELGEGRTRIGRGTDNHLVLEDHDKQVSRVHAEIWHERGRYVIADLNSQNGVWIGERQIKTEEPLPENVWVTIGPYRLMLMPDEQAPYTPEDLDGAEMTRESGAFVEPTQLAEPIPPAPARTQNLKATSSTTPPKGATPAKAPAATPPPKTKGGSTMAIAAVVVAVLVLGVLAVMMTRKSGPDTVTETVANPTTTPPTTSSIPAPTGPAPEEAFQDHYAKAQAFIQQANKAAAREENTAALAALPDDPRGVAQRTAIDAMPEPGAPAQPSLADGASPPGTSPTKLAAPPLPEPLRVSARPGEPEKERATREKNARTQLEDGRKALSERQFDAAIIALQAAIATSGRSDYGVQANEANAMVRQARNGKAAAEATQRHANAQKLVDEAKGLAGSDVAAALQKLREARNLDPEVEGVSELTNSLGEQARVQGESALSSAKNLENRPNRIDLAIKDYERAVRLLEAVPGGHKDLAIARQRLAELKAGK